MSNGAAASGESYADRVDAQTRRLRDHVLSVVGPADLRYARLLLLANDVIRAAAEAQTNIHRDRAIDHLREASDRFVTAFLASEFAELASQCCHGKIEGMCWKCDRSIPCP